MTIRITGDGPKITATGSGATVLVEISTGQHDPGSFSGVHNDLTGRSTAGAHVGTAVSIDPTGFAGNLDGTITNAQLLAAAVDDLTTGGGGGGGGQVADFATITVDTVLTEPKHLIVGGSSPKVTLPDAATWTGQHMVIASNVAYTLTLPDDFGGYDYAKAAYSLTTCISNGGGWQVYDGVPISAGTEGQVLGWESDVLTWITPAGGADLSDTTPQALGTAAAGTGTAAARDDHVHAMPAAADVGADAAGTAASAVSALSSVYQPLDSDLTAIAALSTTSFGRGLLELANAAALLSAAGAAAAVHGHAIPDVTGLQTALDGKAAASNALGYVNHGSTAGTARPSGYAAVLWVGTVEPSNAVNGDLWENPS